MSKRPRAPSGRGGTLAPGSVPQPSCLFGWSSRFLNSDEAEAQIVVLVLDGELAPARAPHAAGVAAGGTTCEDPPGVREGGQGKLYLAYLRDPDGNKLCALHRM